jgi:uncharacterized protein
VCIIQQNNGSGLPRLESGMTTAAAGGPAAGTPCYAGYHFGGIDVIKILLLIAMVFVVLGVLRAYQRSLGKPSAPTRESRVEDMVKCAHCGVNLPRSEAIYSGGAFFCTAEHQKLGKQ